MSLIRSLILAGLTLAAALAGRAAYYSDSGQFSKTYTLSVPSTGSVYAVVTAWVQSVPNVPPSTAVGRTIVVVPGVGEVVNVSATATPSNNPSTAYQYASGIPTAPGPYQIIHMGFLYGPSPGGVNSETTVSW